MDAAQQIDLVREALRRARLRKGIGRKPLAKKVGLGETTVRDIEIGKSKDFQIGTIAKIASELDITVPELFVGSPEEHYLTTTRRSLERAVADALPGLPEDEGRRVQYLVSTVLGVLALPEELPGSVASDDDEGEGAPSTGVRARRSTK